MIFIDGDFPTGSKCKYHCSPTCHPAQVGPDWVYGCTHPAWPQNKVGDFVPIVECGGDVEKCQVPALFLQRQINGLKRRNANMQKKIDENQALIIELAELILFRDQLS